MGFILGNYGGKIAGFIQFTVHQMLQVLVLNTQMRVLNRFLACKGGGFWVTKNSEVSKTQLFGSLFHRNNWLVTVKHP
jgi:hypothetical protein